MMPLRPSWMLDQAKSLTPRERAFRELVTAGAVVDREGKPEHEQELAQAALDYARACGWSPPAGEAA